MEKGEGEEEALEGLQTEKCSQETVRLVYAGIHTLLLSALRQPNLKTQVGVALAHSLSTAVLVQCPQCVWMCILGQLVMSSAFALQVFREDLQLLK